jgi:chromosome partitioning protein
MAEVWAISTNKGGVLKTSITTNLAGVLVQEGHKVLILDTDNQGNAALSFGENPDKFETTLYDVLVHGENAKNAIYEVFPGIDLLPSNDEMVFFEFDVLTNREMYPEPFMLMQKALDPLRREYDFILVDTPPNLGLTQGNVLSFADAVIIPFQPESYSMRSLMKIIKAIEDFSEKYNPYLEILGVLATLVDRRTSLHSEVLQECRRFCIENNIRMFDTIIPRSVRFASSVAYDRLPATLTDRNNPLVSAYFELIREVFENEL